MIRQIGKALRLGDHAALWRATRFEKPPVGVVWFIGRFLNASSIVARRWGPRWATGYRFLGYEIGAWILATAWVGIPLASLVRAVRRLHW